MGYKCNECGANLDPGEKCDCKSEKTNNQHIEQARVQAKVTEQKIHKEKTEEFLKELRKIRKKHLINLIAQNRS